MAQSDFSLDNAISEEEYLSYLERIEDERRGPWEAPRPTPPELPRSLP